LRTTHNIKAQHIWNFDETGIRIAMPHSAPVIVPLSIKSMYYSSPENRKSLTIIETISASGDSLPPYIILEGKRQMCYYFKDNIDERTIIDFSDTGYTNDTIGLGYLKFFIEHATENGRYPALLLYDGAGSHTTDEFKALAEVSILFYIIYF
jgi:hypothetical protein